MPSDALEQLSDAVIAAHLGAVADLALRPAAGVWLSAKATETEAYPDPGIHRST